MENVVLDTNCLVSSLKRSSIYFPIWRDFILGKYCLCFTDDILHEYQEIIEKLTGSPMIARNVIATILNRNNILHVEVFYHFELITADKDDNKFVDCAIKQMQNSLYQTTNILTYSKLFLFLVSKSLI